MNDIFIYDTNEVLKENNIKQETFTIYELVSENSKILSEVIPEFKFDGTVNPITLASELVETVKKHNAYGLSANQCGLKFRVFVMGSGEEYVAFFNPEILEYSEETNHLIEGCLSFPGLGLNITRSNRIRVKYQDYTGKFIESIFEGLTSRIFQHELDHLNGITFDKRSKPLALKLGKQKREKYFKRREKTLLLNNK